MSSSGELCVNCHHPRAGGDDGVPCTECGARNGFVGMGVQGKRRLRSQVGFLSLLIAIGAVTWYLPSTLSVQRSQNSSGPLIDDASWFLMLILAGVLAAMKMISDRLSLAIRWVITLGATLCVLLAVRSVWFDGAIVSMAHAVFGVSWFAGHEIIDCMIAILGAAWTLVMLNVIASLAERAGLLRHGQRLSRLKLIMVAAIIVCASLMIVGPHVQQWWQRTYLPSGLNRNVDSGHERMNQILYQLRVFASGVLNVLVGVLSAYVMYVVVQVRDRLVEE
jgi:hypothetical protein